MHRVRWLFALAGFGFGLVAAASPVIEATDVRSDPGRASIEIAFSEPMATWGQNEIGNGELLDVQPPLACSWFWADDRRLRCSVVDSRGLPGASRFGIRIGDGLYALSGEAVPAQSIDVETARPLLELDEVDWSERERPLLRLRSNQPLDSATLLAHLTLNDQAGALVEMQRVEEVPRGYRESGAMYYDLRPLQSLPRGATWTLTRRHGLTSLAGPLRAEGDLALGTIEGPRDHQLLGARCNEWDQQEAVSDGQKLVLRCPFGQSPVLRFERELSPQALAIISQQLPQGTKLEPRSFYNDRAQSRPMPAGYAIVGLGAGTSVLLSADATWTAGDGEPLAMASRLVIEVGDAPSAVTALTPWLLFRTGAAGTVPFSAINIDGFAIDAQWTQGDELVVLKRTMAIPTLVRNESRTLSFALPRRLRRAGGLLSGSALSANAPKYAQENFAVSVAGFGLLALPAGDDLLVFAYDWDTGAPIVGAHVSLQRSITPAASKRSALTTLTQSTTGADGLATMRTSEVRSLGDNRTPALLLRASYRGQHAVLPLDRTTKSRDDSTDASAWYAASTDESAKVGIAYGSTDKLLYRPGETVKFRLVLRERQRNHLVQPQVRSGWRAQVVNEAGGTSAIPLTDMDAFGVVQGEYRVPDAALDGRYMLDIVLPGTEVDGYRYGRSWGDANATVEFAVAGFRSNDYAVELTLDRGIYGPGDPIRLKVDASYYSGGALDRGRGDFSDLLLEKYFSEIYPQYHDYTFIGPNHRNEERSDRAVLAAPVQYRIVQGNSMVDAQVSRPHYAPDDPSYDEIAIGEIRISAAVLSAAGSSVISPAATATYAAFERYLGLRLDGERLQRSKPIALHAIAVARDGQALADTPVALRVQRADADGKTWIDLAQCELRTPASGACGVVPELDGPYRFMLSAEGAAPVELLRVLRDREPLAEESKPVVLSQPERAFAPGAVAELGLTQPYAHATAVVTIEHHGILAAWTQPLDAKVASLRIPVDAQWAPGVTVGVAVIPRGESAYPAADRKALGAAQAELRIDTVAGPRFALTVPADAKPGAEIALQLTSHHGRPLAVTIAIVDAAVATYVPDLVTALDPMQPQWLGRLRRWSGARYAALAEWQSIPGHPAAGLTVSPPPIFLSTTNDDIGADRLETITVVGSRIKRVDIHMEGKAHDGASMEMMRDAARRGTARVAVGSPRQDFRDAVAWSTLELAPNVVGVQNVRLPDNLTEWRVYAWAVDDRDTMELLQGVIRTSLPLEARLRHPDHAVAGDRIDASATARNRSANISKLDLGISVERAPSPAASAEAHATLAPNAELHVHTTLQVPDAGTVKVIAQASAGDYRDAVTAQFEVVVADGMERKAQSGVIDARVVLPLQASDTTMTLALTRLPFPNLKQTYAFLRDYPHTCMEQHSSRGLAAALAPELAEAGAMDADWPQREQTAARALAELPTHQTESGALNYFPGYDWDGDLYLSAYVALAIAEMERRGFAVDVEVRGKLADYLDEALVVVEVEAGESQVLADERRAFAAAGAAALGSLSQAVIDTLPTADKLESSAAMAALLRATAHEPRLDALRATLLDRIESAATQKNGHPTAAKVADPWLLGSKIRDQCLVIDAFVLADGRDDAAARARTWLLGLVDLMQTRSSFGDTQASAICLLALADYRVRHADNATVDVVAAQADRELGRWHLDATTPNVSAVLAPSGDAALQLSSSGSPGFLALTERRIDLRKVAPAAAGLAVTRDYAILRGARWIPYTGQRIAHGETLRVRLIVAAAKFEHFVAVTDPLPGGFGSLNPTLASTLGAALATTESSYWFDQRRFTTNATYHYATQLPPGRHEIVYYARAEYDGDYVALPAEAELMYGETVHARTAAMRFRIVAE